MSSIETPVIIYLHGGGYLAQFRSSNLMFLKQLAIQTGYPILYINYSLTPEYSYPTALDECYDVYKWVLEGNLGIKPTNIILAGDSTGFLKNNYLLLSVVDIACLLRWKPGSWGLPSCDRES